MSAVAWSLLFISAVNLLIGAVALLPTSSPHFRRQCVPLSAALAVLGLFTLAFAAAS